jgi:LuxR family maltose regulon positive regulatory protein
VAQGRIDEALDWAHAQHLTPEDDLTYVREYEHITLARVLMHQPDPSGTSLRTARSLLDRLRVAAEEGGRAGTLIEILTLQALAHHAEHGRHDIPGALAPLESALRLAEPEGYARLFLGEGVALATLLETLVRRDRSWGYPRRLAFDRTPARSVGQALADPLSERELDVLRLLASDLNGPAISRQLYISLNTLRTHTKNIYAKLGVTSRRAAVTRASELGLLRATR